MRFRIDLKIFLFVILFYFTKQMETYAMIMLFAILHEVGHLLAGLSMGMKPEKMEIMPYGVSISFHLTPRDYNRKIRNGNLLELKRIFVALAGPLTNLIIIFICYHLKIELFTKMILIYSNIVLILFNLLPIYPLDGGRIIKSMLHIIGGKKKAEKYINRISFLCIMLLTILASVLIYKVENISIFIIVIFLWCIFLKEDLVYQRKNKIYDLLDKTIEIK